MAWGIKSEGNRTVIRQDGVARAAFNEDGSFELLTPAANPTGNDVPTAGQLPFTKEYVSPEQTITSAGLLSLAHELGEVPVFWFGTLVCKTAEAGYSVGDTISANTSSDAGSSTGCVYVPDSTNISVRYGSGASVFIGLNKTTGAVTTLTNANWRLIVRAWA